MKLQTLFRSSAPIFDQKKRLPAHTFCPLVGHKKKGFFFREQDLQENTVSAEEVFADPKERFDLEKNQDGDWDLSLKMFCRRDFFEITIYRQPLNELLMEDADWLSWLGFKMFFFSTGYGVARKNWELANLQLKVNIKSTFTALSRGITASHKHNVGWYTTLVSHGERKRVFLNCWS